MSWKQKFEQAWPRANVVGKLADQPGYLIKIDCAAMDTHQLGRLQETLIQHGCTGWNWKHKEHTMTVRAYVAKRNRAFQAAMLLAALAILLLYSAYDVRIAKIVRLQGYLHG